MMSCIPSILYSKSITSNGACNGILTVTGWSGNDDDNDCPLYTLEIQPQDQRVFDKDTFTITIESENSMCIQTSSEETPECMSIPSNSFTSLSSTSTICTLLLSSSQNNIRRHTFSNIGPTQEQKQFTIEECPESPWLILTFEDTFKTGSHEKKQTASVTWEVEVNSGSSCNELCISSKFFDISTCRNLFSPRKNEEMLERKEG